jgi:hypothetical protein
MQTNMIKRKVFLSYGPKSGHGQKLLAYILLGGKNPFYIFELWDEFAFPL